MGFARAQPIYELHEMGLAIDPFENDPSLVVDPDRMELVEIAFQLFQPVGWRDRQILQPACGIDGFELALGCPGDPRELTNPFVPEQRLGGLVAKGADHDE